MADFTFDQTTVNPDPEPGLTASETVVELMADAGEATNRVFDTVAAGFVSWRTPQPDPGGFSYPGPGTFGVDTSGYCVTAST